MGQDLDEEEDSSARHREGEAPLQGRVEEGVLEVRIARHEVQLVREEGEHRAGEEAEGSSDREQAAQRQHQDLDRDER